MNWDDCSRDQVAHRYCDERDATFYVGGRKSNLSEPLRGVCASCLRQLCGWELLIIDRVRMSAKGQYQITPALSDPVLSCDQQLALQSADSLRFEIDRQTSDRH